MTITKIQMIEWLEDIKERPAFERDFTHAIAIIDQLQQPANNASLVLSVEMVKDYGLARNHEGFQNHVTIMDKAITALSTAPELCPQQQNDARIELNSALKRVDGLIMQLEGAGFTNCGGKLMKPPLGPNPFEQPLDVLQTIRSSQCFHLTNDPTSVFTYDKGSLKHRNSADLNGGTYYRAVDNDYKNILNAIFDGNIEPYEEPDVPEVLEQIPATYTHDTDAEMYYFAPSERAPGPYLKQIKIEAIVDVASDGSLAGIEFDSAQIEQSERPFQNHGGKGDE